MGGEKRKGRGCLFMSDRVGMALAFTRAFLREKWEWADIIDGRGCFFQGLIDLTD